MTGTEDVAPRIVVVHHSPTPATTALTEAVLAGVRHPELPPLEVVVLEALATTPATAEVLRGAAGVLLGTPANFGYMSGALKHFFDTTFLALGGALEADTTAGSRGTTGPPEAPRPHYGLYVHGRYDTVGAIRAVESFTTALRWRPAVPVLDVLGDVAPHRESAAEWGATLAAVAAGL
ncbi:flavodoxin family protein [Nocardioides sp.]|uniref:flavodoxin family protein n=1 Tax=Nocardioides sp. TaxID=35761 RepID=UPI0035169B6C